MTYLLRSLVVSVVTLGAILLGTSADATRPVPGYDYPDLCKNIGRYAMPGVQGAYLFPMHLRFVRPYAEPNRFGRKACVRTR